MAKRIKVCPHCGEHAHTLECLPMVEAERDTLRALLRELYWVRRWDEHEGWGNFCPICASWEDEGGHAHDCRLKAALEGHDG